MNLMTDYKDYSLNKLREWISDALGEATSEEIYETILSEVDEYTECYKKRYEQGLNLQYLLRGHRNMELFDTKWTSVVEEDSITGEQMITLPSDLLEQIGWKEGDEIEWVTNSDGTISLHKGNYEDS